MHALAASTGALPAPDALAVSADALDRALRQDSELSVVEITTSATVLGAFQRRHDVPADQPVLRRVSGGPFVRVGPGTLHIVLALREPAALVPCDAGRIVNRYVRPLLRALTKRGALAHYFGREWISVGHRPVGQVGFAHDSRTGRAAFEAFVAVHREFAPAERASFLGKEPGTLSSVTGLPFDNSGLRDEIVSAYAALADTAVIDGAVSPSAPSLDEVRDEPPWTAWAVEAIGKIAAGRDAAGALRLGGDLLASRDAIDRVATLVDALPPGASVAEVGDIVDRELAAPGVALDGVRSLASVRDVLFAGR